MANKNKAEVSTADQVEAALSASTTPDFELTDEDAVIVVPPPPIVVAAEVTTAKNAKIVARRTLNQVRIGEDYYSFVSGKQTIVPQHVLPHLREINVI